MHRYNHWENNCGLNSCIQNCSLTGFPVHQHFEDVIPLSSDLCNCHGEICCQSAYPSMVSKLCFLVVAFKVFLFVFGVLKFHYKVTKCGFIFIYSVQDSSFFNLKIHVFLQGHAEKKKKKRCCTTIKVAKIKKKIKYWRRCGENSRKLLMRIYKLL